MAMTLLPVAESLSATQPVGVCFSKPMRSILMVVAGILPHGTFEMAFFNHDDIIEQVSSAVADPALGDAILPRTAEAGSLWLDAEALDGADDFLIEL